MQCIGERKRGSYHCTSPDGVSEKMSSTKTDWKMTHRSAMVQLLGGVYGLSIVVLGLVFALAAALTFGLRNTYGQDSFYLEVFQIFLYVASLLFLAYLHAHLLRAPVPQQTITVPNKLKAEEKSAEKINLEELESGEKTSPADHSRSVTPMPNAQLPPRTVCPRPRVTFDGKEVNFYLRLGTIVFGTGSMVHDGFRLSQLLQDGQLSFRCLSPLDIVVIILHVVFTFFQTFYLFKSHKIIIHQQKGVVRFGFIQLIATNLCVWILTTVDEIHADVIVTLDDARSNVTGGAAACVPVENLSWKASPYLYPCTIQYSLIAIAIVCQMHRNISTTHARSVEESRGLTNGDDVIASARDVTDDARHVLSSVAVPVDCDKAHKGLFLGLVVVVLTLVAVSCYFVFGTGSSYFHNPRDAVYYSGFIFFFAELALLGCSSIAVLIGFIKFRTLKFSPLPGDHLETALLIFALGGVIAMECFHAVSAVSSINGVEDVGGMLAVCTSAVLLLQVFLQTVFVVDTLRRSIISPIQERRKPGRTLITFLLLCNVALLIVSVFEVKKTENLQIHAVFYGHLAWSAISHFTVPLNIFFRFHSVVCLSDIWINAYRLIDQ